MAADSSTPQEPETSEDHNGLLSKQPLKTEVKEALAQEGDDKQTEKELGLTAGFVALFLFIHVLAVSGWNWDTAADIADSFNFEDSISIVFGTLFELPVVTGLFTAIILPITLFRIYWTRKTAGVDPLLKNLFISGALLATQYVLLRSFEMWWPSLATVIIFLFLVLISRIWVQGKAHVFIANLGKHAGILLLVGLGALGLLVDTPWMPREEIVTEQGVIYGHVLESTPGFLKVLTDEREVHILLDSDVLRRTPAD